MVEIEALLGGKIFGWFAREHDKAKRLMPEAKWLVECEGDVLRTTDDKQGVKRLQLPECVVRTWAHWKLRRLRIC